MATTYDEIFIDIISRYSWTEDTEKGRYYYYFPFSNMNFEAATYSISRILRRDENMSYRNIVLSYEITSGGDLYIYSDEPFTGKIKLTAG